MSDANEVNKVDSRNTAVLSTGENSGIVGNVAVLGGLAGEVVVQGIIKKKMPDYKGNYTVRPSASEQILETANKTMLEDVTVEAIPYYTTTNPMGGYTITIGE